MSEPVPDIFADVDPSVPRYEPDDPTPEDHEPSDAGVDC